MCGRFALYAPAEVIGEIFQIDVLPELVARYNIAPTQDVLAVRDDGGARTAAMFRWGLQASRFTDARIHINARSESAGARRAFRDAMKTRRLLVPMNGFYEWTGSKKARQPHWIAFRDARPFAVAGLWEEAADGTRAATLLTTAANPQVAALHDRMPAILPPEVWSRWLDPAAPDPAALLAPWDGDDLVRRRVSNQVNSVDIEGPGLLGPPEQTVLF